MICSNILGAIWARCLFKHYGCEARLVFKYILSAKQDFCSDILGAKQGVKFCSNILDATHDFCWNILGVKQEFCSEICVAKQDFCLSIMDGKQDFCSDIWGTKQDFVQTFYLQSLGNIFVKTGWVQSNTFAQKF